MNQNNENIDPTLDTEQDDSLNSWLMSARDAYESSSTWFDASVRRTTEKAMAHFSNRHAPGSKYYSDQYKYRSKGFRPKTRATIRRNEAAAAIAFFSTQDMVSITPENQSDDAQVVSAGVLTELLNYRLTDSIPWFQTAIGAYQNAMNVGVVISRQSWEFEEEEQDFPTVDQFGSQVIDAEGNPAMQTMRRTITDKPRIDLVAIENFRISPAADWTDPVGTSPFTIELIPMFIGDVKEKMANGKWKQYEDGAIQGAAQNQYDSIRAARDGQKRVDGVDVTYATSDFDTIFVHLNIIRKGGKDHIFYTLGTHLMLTEPKLLEEEYPHLRRGERPYVMGSCIIETHKTYPAGSNELLFGLQENANEISNQRQDNVSLVMNKRYFAKRTANVDFKSLTRNVPGSVTLVDDIDSDIRWDSPPDVTGSSYQEQDRVSLDFDELAGTFSPGSVQSNRQTGDTVGGMNLMSADANTLTEYQLRVFSETWVEPVLKQLVRMEQAYETDELVMAIAGERSKMMQKFGIDKMTDQLIQGTVNVNVNIGFGATNPQKRIEKLTMGLNTIASFAPNLIQQMDVKEVVSEVFGALGWKSADRFFPSLGEDQQNPQIQAMQQQIQELQQALQTKQVEWAARKEIAEMNNHTKEQIEASRLQVRSEDDTLDRELAKWSKEIDAQLAAASLSAEERVSLNNAKVTLSGISMKLNAQQQLAAANGKGPQLIAPPNEPAGRAPNGQAYQA